MTKKTIEKLTFVGRPFMASIMDDQKTFTPSNSKMEQDPVFQAFLKQEGLENQRATMVEFAPESFMYWYGIVSENEIKVPKGLMKFDLPAGEIAQEEEKGQLSLFNLPINFQVQSFFEKLINEGIKVYQNPGDSNTPYFVQKLTIDKQKIEQFWYLGKK